MTASQWNPLTTTDVRPIVTSSLSEQQLLNDKSLRAVIENYPDMDTDESAVDNDVSKVKLIFADIGISDSLLAENIHQHGNPKNGPARIVKVPFRDTASRDLFIQKFNKYRSFYFGGCPKPVTCRRDLLAIELLVHYSMRKECYDRNQTAGQLKYYYRDLEIYEYREPGPFKKQ